MSVLCRIKCSLVKLFLVCAMSKGKANYRVTFPSVTLLIVLEQFLHLLYLLESRIISEYLSVSMVMVFDYFVTFIFGLIRTLVGRLPST